MVRKINALGDRMLRALLPKAEAQASHCWIEYVISGCTVEECCTYPGTPLPTYCFQNTVC
jgi:hypothetical protein